MRGIKAQLASIAKRSGRLLTALLFIGVLTLTALPPRPQQLEATHGSGTHLYLLWDGTNVAGGSISLPSGWSIVNTYDGRFLRADAVADFGTTATSGTHTPTATVATNLVASNATSSGGAVAGSNHTHPTASVTIGAASNSDEPAYRAVRLIRYDAGIPTFIPNGAIAMFDSIPSSGWVQQTTFNDRFIKINSTLGNGGTDTHTHSLTWSGLGASSGTAAFWNTFLNNTNVATNGHTHSAPAATATASTTSFPPHVRPLIAKANGDTIAIPANLLGMFDGFAGSGWVHRSETGQSFNEQFLRTGTSYTDTSAGSLTHTHAQEAAATSQNVGSTPTTSIALGTASLNHSHVLTATFDPVESIPNYFNIAIAEKINFILRDYRWFEDPGSIGQPESEDVTDPWSSLDVAEQTPIPAIPAQFNPPEPTDELRLRLKVEVSGDNLPASDIAFTLQYKAATDEDCSTVGWTDVGASGGGSIWRFATSGVADGTSLSNSRFVAPSSVLQTYNISNPTGANPNGAIIGNTIEYDFHLEHNGAENATKYSFRLIESTGPLLAEYAECPTLTTKPGTENQLRHGNFFEGGVERGFSWAD